MSDLFHEDLTLTEQTDIFEVMALCPQHIFQVLTKRADHLYRLKDIGAGIAYRLGMQKVPGFIPLKNVWIGVSIENQEYADKRRDDLKRIAEQGWLTWVSYEPALGPVGWQGWEFLRWLVAGGESGPGSRPSQVAWYRQARDFCAVHDIEFFMKQMGARPISIEDRISHKGNKSQRPDGFYRYLNDPKGGEPAEWPADLQVREFPCQ